MEENQLRLVQKCRDLKIYEAERAAVQLAEHVSAEASAQLCSEESVCLFPSILSIRLVISLEDHVLPLICKTPTHCQTHLGIISFPFHRAPLLLCPPQ